jgi:hypothetical protein
LAHGEKLKEEEQSMKKLVVLSALLGLLALPMFAIDFSFGGDATFGFIADFSDDAPTTATTQDLSLDLKGNIDDYNSLAISLDELESGLAGLEKAIVTTDVGKWLGLPIGLTVNWGWDDPDANEFEAISYFGNEQVFNFSPDEWYGIEFLISYKFIQLEMSIKPIEAATDAGYFLAGLAVKEPVAGLNAEVYYYQNEGVDAFDVGQIGIDAAYSTEIGGIGLDAGAAFLIDLNDAATDGWAWGFALKGAYDMFAVDVGLNGNETDAFAFMTAFVQADVVEQLSLYGGLELDFQEATADAFQAAELGVIAHPGKVNVFIGYFIAADALGSYTDTFEAPAAQDGFFVKFDVNY